MMFFLMFWLMTFYSLSTIFQGLRFLSHCPIKKDDIMYVIFSKIESLEKVCHCCSFYQMCLMPKKLLTTEVVFTGSCKLKSQNCSRHIDCCNWYESCKKLPWSTYFFILFGTYVWFLTWQPHRYEACGLKKFETFQTISASKG